VGVHRRKLLQWLAKLQRKDGSFGQNLWDETPVGGSDMRHSYLASLIRWMLRGSVEKGDAAWVEDIDVEAMIAHIRNGQVPLRAAGDTSCDALICLPDL
jgi:geranylgeranyl transferase type-1 subunit beta